MNNVWYKTQQPIFIQAPMENVTDTAFRQMLAKCGKPDIFFTEFTSADGLLSPGRKSVAHRLKYTEIERPIIAQIWGNNPDILFKTAQILQEMRFDGIDVNMGCPDRTVVKKGAGAALINHPKLAEELINAVKEGANGLPVSIKTRLGFNKIITEEWIGFLLSLNLDAITIHARTAKQKSEGPANWEEVGKAVEMKNKMKSKTLIIGNGDIKSKKQGLEMVEKYGVDGVMIGRGIFSNLWIFNDTVQPEDISVKEKIELLLEHIELHEKIWGESKNFLNLRKFFRAYINGFPGASDLRTRFMTINSLAETKKEVIAYLNQLDR